MPALAFTLVPRPWSKMLDIDTQHSFSFNNILFYPTERHPGLIEPPLNVSILCRSLFHPVPCLLPCRDRVVRPSLPSFSPLRGAN